MSTKLLALQIGNAASYLFMLGMNLNPYFMRKETVIAHKHNTDVTPADWAFSIWALIYSLLAVFTMGQALPRNRVPNGVVEKIGVLYMVSCVANGCWLLVFSRQAFLLSVGIIVILLGSLIGIYQRLHIGATPKDAKGWLIRFLCVDFTFSLYLAWVTVATIVNVSVMLSSKPFNWHTDEAKWSIAMQLFAVGLSFFMLHRHRDFTFAGVMMWTLLAIGLKFHAVSVTTASFVCLGVLGSGIAFTATRTTLQKSAQKVRHSKKKDKKHGDAHTNAPATMKVG